VYSLPIVCTAIGSPTTINAIAVDPLGNLSDSPMSSDIYIINYAIVASPTFSPVAGTYRSTQTVIFSSATPGASFKYTTDGTVPTLINGTVGNSVTVNDTTPFPIQVYAFKGGMTNSAVMNANYLIAPTIQWISPTSHTRANPVHLRIHGTFFKAGATVKLTRGGQPDINGFNYSPPIPSNDIFFDVNLVGRLRARWNVVVTNPDGGTYTLVNGFRIR
jgi:hypothetical protein